MNVLVLGANGNTGFRVVRRLAEHPGYAVRALIREAGQAGRFEALGVETVVEDLETLSEKPFTGCDAAIFCAGSGGHTGKDKTVLVDQLGAIRSMVMALNEGCRRYVMLSGLGVDRDDEGDRIPHWRRAKGRADDFLRTMPKAFAGEGLDYTIVCPGRLSDDDSVPGIRLIDPAGEGPTSREQLAATLVACLDLPRTIGRTFGVIDGPEPPTEALRRAF